jgi:hypothetical protein
MENAMAPRDLLAAPLFYPGLFLCWLGALVAGKPAETYNQRKTRMMEEAISGRRRG